MLARNSVVRRPVILFAALGVLAIASCGEDTDFGLGKLYPVSGKVTYNDQPLEKGQITFTPEDTKGGVGATGDIENGSYTMGTVGDKNGARPGKYKVMIVAKEDAEAQAKAEFEKAQAKTPNVSKSFSGNTARIPREFVVKATKEAKSLIPAGYGDLRTTNLTAEVKEASNTFDFPLSDKNAPPAPPKESAGKGRRR